MAKVESFDGLISSIQEAFLSVNRMAENQHLESLEEFLEDDGTPKTMRVKYPFFNESGDVDYRFVDIPALCLIPISTLKLSEVSVDFQVKLSAEVSLKRDDDAENAEQATPSTAAPPVASNAVRRRWFKRSRARMGFIPGFRQKRDDSYANITLKFVAEEAPEGMLRIRDEMIKILP